MKKFLLVLLAFSLVFGLVLGCGEDSKDTKDTNVVVKTVTVTAANGAAMVGKGFTLQFSATVSGKNKPSQAVTWEVTPTPSGAAGVSISGAGLLSIAKESTATSIAVVATSVLNESVKSAPVSITVSEVIKCLACDETYIVNTPEEAAHDDICFCNLEESMPSWADCTCDYYSTLLKIVKDGEGGSPAVPDELDDQQQPKREKGMGYIVDKDWQLLRNAPRGSQVLIYANGTENLNWDSLGSVGVGPNVDDQNNRVAYKAPDAFEGGDYTITIAMEDYWRVGGFDTAAFGNVNCWGIHTISKVITTRPKTPVTDKVDILRGDFYIDATLTFIGEVPSTESITVTPRHNMSQGAITFFYQPLPSGTKTITPPTAFGRYRVTFVVAAWEHFNAAELTLGNLEILAAKPFYYDYMAGPELEIGPFVTDRASIGGIEVPNLRQSKYLVIETITPTGQTGIANNIMFLLAGSFNNGWGDGPVNSTTALTSVRTAGDTAYLVLDMWALFGEANVKANNSYANMLHVSWGGATQYNGLNMQRAWLVKPDVVHPIGAGVSAFGAVSATNTASRGYFYNKTVADAAAQ